MAVVVRGFQQPDLTNPVQTWQPGAAAFLGTQTLSNWGMSNENQFGVRTAKSIGASNITLSGGQTIYNAAVPQTLPNYQTTDNDTISNLSTTAVYNPIFIGKDSDGYTIGLTISYGLGLPPNNEKCFKILPFGYKQTPTGTKNVRTTWNYYDYPIGTSYNPGAGYMQVENNPTWQNYPLVKMYRTTLFETEYYCFAFGVNAANQPAILSGQYVGAVFFIVPCAWFEDRIPVPFVGDTSEPDPETAFYPVEKYSDTITGRTDFNVNPYGVNDSGGGIKIVFPSIDGEGTPYTGYLSDILSGIYRGANDGFLNMASQTIAEYIGGNTARAWDEIQAIYNGIVSCHTVPVLTSTYFANAATFKTVCGYNVLLNTISLGSPGQQTIFSRTFYSDIIDQRLNCFLDFEPYTAITLKIPFCSPIQIQPSALYGKSIKVSYKIDILTGLLSADISIYSSSTDYIISTLQANVKTNIPIMGAGASDPALNKIASSTISLLSSFGAAPAGASGEMSSGFSFNIPQAAGAIYSGMDAISKAGAGVPVGQMSVDGLGVYLASRSAYIIISRPTAAVPAGQDEQYGSLQQNYLEQVGLASNVGGKVSFFAGGFAKFRSVDLSAVNAPEEIKRDILTRLNEGVYIK